MTAVGWLGNACYCSRFLVQWLVSERRRRSVTPRSFWWLSACGAGCLLVYTVWSGEPILLLGYLITLAIYVRNLLLQRGARALGHERLPTTVAAGVVAWLVMVTINFQRMEPQLALPVWTITIGSVGQAVWSSRFLLQWIEAERAGRSDFTERFWWTSLVGNVLLLGYTVARRDPVLIAGLALGPVVQVRNLWILGALGLPGRRHPAVFGSGTSEPPDEGALRPGPLGARAAEEPVAEE